MPDPFISREDLSDYLGRDVTTDDGALIAVDSACDIVRTITEQDFSPASETIKLDGTGTDTVLLPQVPVTAAGTVSVNGEEVTNYVVTDRGYLVRTCGTADDHSTWSQLSGPSSYWPQGRQNIEVTYDHGYATSGTVTDIPADVRVVALMIAARLSIQGVNIQRQVGGDLQRYAVASTDLTENEKRILRKYRESM